MYKARSSFGVYRITVLFDLGWFHSPPPMPPPSRLWDPCPAVFVPNDLRSAPALLLPPTPDFAAFRRRGPMLWSFFPARAHSGANVLLEDPGELGDEPAASLALPTLKFSMLVVIFSTSSPEVVFGDPV